MLDNNSTIPSINTRTLYRNFQSVLNLLASYGKVKLTYRNKTIAVINKTKDLDQIITRPRPADIDSILDQVSGLFSLDYNYKKTYKQKLQKKYG